MTERDMVMDCYDYYKHAACCETVVLEVPFLSRCIDMVIIHNGVLWTIEFKFKNIRQAIEQARDHALGADTAYICIPERGKINTSVFEQEGICLMFYSPNEKQKIKVEYTPDSNKNQVALFRNMLLENIMKVTAVEMVKGAQR